MLPRSAATRLELAARATSNVLVMRATMAGPLDAALPRARQYFSDLLAQAATLPGVLAVGATMAPPGYVDSTGVYFLDRVPPQSDGIVPPAS